ncbi:conserved Plasmodium protein, unknown function [Plasmodium ovale]|uniref:EF-hand domain-containing protein n=1 Tax=Plasmodium ovale TaxID=36330 RepID=A0A1D3KY01_PLAOA|nr:conserved Plasmodium protein, unknown function [Plasmodium ovale]
MQGLKKICGQVLGERWISNSARSHRKNVSILCAQRKDNYHSIHGGIHGVSVGTCCWDGPFCRARKHISGYWAECTKKKIHDSKINEWREQFSILKDYDDKDLLMWRDSFNKMDKDKDNFISHADLQKSDWSLEKYTLFQNYDMDKNNLIDFGEYIQAVIDIDTQYFKNFFQGFSKIDIELEFQKYAITEKENNKKVIPLTKLMQMLKDKEFTCVTERDSLQLFNAMDLDKDGSLDFEDFVGWLGKK